MKTILQKTLIAIACLLCSIGTSAHDFEVDGIYYRILSEANKTVKVTYRGDKYNSYDDEYTGSVVIPENVTYSGTRYSITSIEVSAFSDCIGLTSITIPNSITSIGVDAFCGCTGLTSITIPNSITSIDNDTFSGCVGLKELTIEDGDNTLTLGYNSSRYQRGGLFSDCPIETLYLGRNLSYSSSLSPFYDIEELKSVIISSSVTSIGSYAFSGCTELTSIVIPGSVTKIDSFAFKGCTGLTSITIPNSVTSIGDNAFTSCVGLKELIIEDGDNTLKLGYKYDSYQKGGLFSDYPIETLYLGRNLSYSSSLSPFNDIEELKSVVIGSSVTSISNYSFRYCINLTSITIPNSVDSIGSYAFYGCTSLTDITIPNSVTSVGSSAFNGCTGLTSVTIGNSVTSISNYAFYGCTSLTNIRIPNSVTSVGSNAFNGCTGLTEITIPNSVSSLGSYAFSRCTGLTEITIPNGVSSIGSNAFYGCCGLTDITIPNSVTSIGSNAFDHCKNLTEVTIGSGITSIGKWAFNGCTGLKLVNFNAVNCTTIGEPSYPAFNDCANLSVLNIGDKVTNIPDSAFYKCEKLTDVYCKASIPPTIQLKTFDHSSYERKSLYVPIKSISAYDNDNYWMSFCVYGIIHMEDLCYRTLSETEVEVTYKNKIYNNYSGKIVIPEVVMIDEDSYDVTSIGESAFSSCTGLTDITIPSSVTSIGRSAFSGCTGLTSVTIPNSVTFVSHDAFNGCTGLTEITIPNSVTSVGSSAFSGCTGLTSVTIPNSVTFVSHDAFNGCTGLTEITIPNSVTSVGSSAFSGCTGLTSVTIPNSVTSIGDNAFTGCVGLKELIIEDGDNTLSLGYKSDKSTYQEGLFSDSPIETLYLGRNLSYSSSLSSFNDIEELKSVVIGSSVTSIGNETFYGCTGLTSITIPNSVTSVGSSAFSGCTGLTSVTIGNSVTSIGSSAFSRCTGLTSITIPNSVNSIGSYAFYGCGGLTEVHCKASIPPAIQNSTFDTSSKTILYVPAKSIMAYKEAEYWNRFSINDKYAVGDLYYNILSETEVEVTYKDENYNSYSGDIEIPEVVMIEGNPYDVIKIGSEAFKNCTGLTSIIIPNSVTSIGSYAFYGCSSLAEVHCKATIPPVVQDYAFPPATQDYAGVTIYVPIKSISAYKNAQYWKWLNISEKYRVGDLYYMALSETEVEVTYKDDNYNSYSGSIVIPEVVFIDDNPYDVIKIGDKTFKDCIDLTEVIVEKSIASIGEEAFSGCNGLTSIVVEKDNMVYDSRENCNAIIETATNVLYIGCKNTIIPNSVTSIGDKAFLNCRGLTSITIPESVISIGNDAFDSCLRLRELTIADGDNTLMLGYDSGSYSAEGLFSDCPIETLYLGRNLSYQTGSEYGYSPFNDIEELKSVVISSSVTSIGDYAFEGCIGLTSITIPNSVTSISDGAFYDCFNLTEITIGNSVTSIGDKAFLNCRDLTSITIPESVTSIGNDAFNSCLRLRELTIADGDNTLMLGYNSDGYQKEGLFSDCPIATLYLSRNLSYETGNEYGYSPFYDIDELKSVIIGSGVTSIGDYAFSGCTGLTEISIGNSVTLIGSYAFDGCTGLTEITIGNSVTSIRNSAFEGCSGLKTVNFNAQNCIYMGWGEYPAFNNCNNIKTVNIGDNVKRIPLYAFSGCTGLTEISIGNSVTLIGSYAFDGCTGLTEISIGNSVTLIGSYAFDGCTGLTSITIPNSVTSIGSYAFNDCGLTSMTIPNSVSCIDEGAFYDCTRLTSINIPNSVTSIGSSAFKGCCSLTSITIPNSVTCISDGAFEDCTGLTSITIPNSVNSIGSYAFYGCGGLTEVHCKASIPPAIQYYTFDASSIAILYVPAKSIMAYKKAEYWNRFSINDKYAVGDLYYNILSETEVEVTYKDENYNSYSGDIEIPEVVMIEGNPYDVIKIGSEAFKNSTGLTSIILPNSVTSIGSAAFKGCCDLTDITIPNSVTSIGSSAFYDCSSLTSITIPSSVISIDDYTFYDCFNLAEVTIGSRVAYIGSVAFKGCDCINRIIVKPNIPPSISASTFSAVTNEKAVLEVPKGRLSTYKDALYWCYFINIEETGSGSINTTVSDNINIGIIGGTLSINGVADDAVVNIYTTSGMLLHHTTVAGSSNIALPSGIYLIQVDGITKKVAV